MSIKRLTVENFRRFDRFDMSFRSANVLVGPNNSGKSSILDAFRILQSALRTAYRRNPVVASQGSDGVCATHELALSAIDVPLSNITRNYSDDPALLTFLHENGAQLRFSLHPERMPKVYLVADGAIPRSASQFKKHFPLQMVIVPTLSPVEEHEQRVAEETIRRNESTRLSSRNFRNIWRLRPAADFEQLREIVRTSWKGIDIKPPEVVGLGNDALVKMFFSENRIERELYWSGFGLQVWLQMLTHLLRGTSDSIVIVDEPDVYLHPDLQRRLIRFLKERFSQVILATHSVEIINESDPGDVVSINPANRSARRVTTEDEYKSLFSYIGSTENVDFARLARAKRIVFFEGGDRRILRRLAARLKLTRVLDDPDTTFLKAGGFGQWRRVKEVKWTLHEVLKLNVSIYAIFDRDYRSDEEVKDFVDTITSEGIICRVLCRKEIENYFLELNLLRRVIAAKADSRGHSIRNDDVDELVESLTLRYEDDVQSQRAANYSRFHRSSRRGEDEAVLLREANTRFRHLWRNTEMRLRVLPGKEFISLLSASCQARFGFGLSLSDLAQMIRTDEIDSEIVDVLSELENM